MPGVNTHCYINVDTDCSFGRLAFLVDDYGSFISILAPCELFILRRLIINNKRMQEK